MGTYVPHLPVFAENAISLSHPARLLSASASQPHDFAFELVDVRVDIRAITGRSKDSCIRVLGGWGGRLQLQRQPAIYASTSLGSGLLQCRRGLAEQLLCVRGEL